MVLLELSILAKAAKVDKTEREREKERERERERESHFWWKSTLWSSLSHRSLILR